MSPTGSSCILHNVRVLEEDGGFSEETSVVVEDGVVTGIGPSAGPPVDAPADGPKR